MCAHHELMIYIRPCGLCIHVHKFTSIGKQIAAGVVCTSKVTHQSLDVEHILWQVYLKMLGTHPVKGIY